MTGLEKLPDQGFRFSAVPPKVAGMGTFPVRAYAVVGADVTARWQARIASHLESRLLAELPAIEAELAGIARLRSAHPAEDGGERLLVELADGQTVESVLLPRDGLCISSQVGCAVGCVFCMTGRDGLARQLTSGEIVAYLASTME